MKSLFSRFRLLVGWYDMYYAVRIGRRPGVYSSWAECEAQVKGFPKARYKKFGSVAAAEDFIGIKSSGPQATSQPGPEHGAQTSKPEPQYVFVPETAAENVDPLDRLNNSGEFTSEPPLAVPLSPHLKDEKVKAVPAGDDNNPTVISPPLAEVQPAPSKTVTSKTMLSSTRLLALKSTLSTVHQLTAQLTTFVSQAEEQLENLQAGKKRGEKRAAPSSTIASASSASSAGRGTAKRKANRSASSTLKNQSSENADGGSVIDVWTDGCCHGNGTEDACAGIGVYWGPHDQFNVAEPLDGRPTNNRAEIHAAIKAIQIAQDRGIRHLRVNTDSQFLIKSITEWIRNWKLNGWMTSSGQPVINRDDFEELDQEIRQGGVSVSWQYVAGHAGNLENEEADRLANAGARMSHD